MRNDQPTPPVPQDESSIHQANLTESQKNLEYYIEDAFDQADRDLKKMKSDGELSPKSWKEFASKQEVTLDSDLSLLPAGTKNPMAWPAILTDFERMKSGQPHLLWQEYSGEMRMSKTPPKKPFSAGKIRDQFIALYVCLTLVVITLFFLIRTSFRSVRANSNVFTTASGKIIPYHDMKTLDLRKWDTKGIASSSNPMNNESLPVCLAKTTGGDYFDEIVIGRFTRISFHRTLRIPEDGRDYPLPAGLGRFPIHRVEDYADKVPVNWLKEGGFFIPLYQKEALFLQFESPDWHPTIAKICVGRISAITGNAYSEELSKHKQDYVVIPNQKWLDGICISEGVVKQFIAVPLGYGYTIEAQITDEEKEAGFQIVVMDAFENRFPQIDPKPLEKYNQVLYQMDEEVEMGVASGGRIK